MDCEFCEKEIAPNRHVELRIRSITGERRIHVCKDCADELLIEIDSEKVSKNVRKEEAI